MNDDKMNDDKMNDRKINFALEYQPSSKGLHDGIGNVRNHVETAFTLDQRFNVVKICQHRGRWYDITNSKPASVFMYIAAAAYIYLVLRTLITYILIMKYKILRRPAKIPEKLDRLNLAKTTIDLMHYSIIDFSKFDVFFCCYLLAGLSMNEIVKNVPTIVGMSHDIIPIRRPSSTSAGLDGIRIILNKALRRFTHIISVSDFSQADIINYAKENNIPIKESNMVVNKLASDTHAIIQSKTKQEQILNKYNIKERKYAAILCTVEPRKNHRMLVEIWRQMSARGTNTTFPLVIIGMNGWMVDDLYREINNDKYDIVLHNLIICTGTVNDETKYILLKNAKFSLFPSFMEGWGLPITESLRVGTPVISSDNSSMPEAGYGVTEMIDVLDMKKWYETILQYINDDELVEKKRQEIAKIKLRTWDEFDKDLCNIVYNAVLENKQKKSNMTEKSNIDY